MANLRPELLVFGFKLGLDLVLLVLHGKFILGQTLIVALGLTLFRVPGLLRTILQVVS